MIMQNQLCNSDVVHVLTDTEEKNIYVLYIYNNTYGCLLLNFMSFSTPLETVKSLLTAEGL